MACINKVVHMLLMKGLATFNTLVTGHLILLQLIHLIACPTGRLISMKTSNYMLTVKGKQI